MNSAIDVDSRERPELFNWAGPVPRADLLCWLQRFGQWVPKDLLQLWMERGGGDMFEGEEILSPVKQNDYIGTVEDRTAWYQAQGLTPSVYLFHEGSVLSAIDPDRRILVVVSSDMTVGREFSTFEEWYRAVARRTGERFYGLPTL